MSIGGIWQSGQSVCVEAFNFSARGLGVVLGPDVRIFTDEDYILFFEGQVYGVKVDKILSDITALETAFGHYCYVRLQKATGRVDIGTDRLGYYPIYYAFDGWRLVFGSTLNYVKSKVKRPSPDFDAWEELLVLGEVIGDKSTVKEVKRLPSGTRLVIENEAIKFVRFWTPECPEVVDDHTYIRQNNALLDEAVALTASQRRQKIVLLSGGEDSRRIALASVRVGLDVKFHTQQAPHRGGADIDTALARKVATALGHDISVEPLPSCQQYVADWQARDPLLGFECIAHEWLLPLVRRIAPESIIYDGIVGDITINGHYFKHYPQSLERFASTESLARMVCGADAKPWLNELRRRTTSHLVERVDGILATYPASPHRLNWYFLLNHTRRKISLVSQFFAMQGHWTCYPFMYYPLLVQSLSADPRQQKERFFQRECMAAVAPEIAAIPTTRGDVPADYLENMSDEDYRQRRALRKQLEISEEALDVFPLLRTKYRMLNKMRFPPADALLQRFGWFFEPVSRFSAFLEWLNNSREA